jgi:hypothetical protein
MKFISKNDYECPYCQGQLKDEERDGKEVKVCYSELCQFVAGFVTGRVFDSADID